MSPIPDLIRYASAFFAVPLGSLSYGSFLTASNISQKIFKVLLIIAILFIVLGLIRNGINLIGNNPTYSLSSFLIPKYKHLVWDIPDNYNLIIFFVIITSILYIYPKNKILFILLILYYFIPGIYSYKTTPLFINKNSAGSYWCWIVAVFSFIIYIVNPLVQKYNN